MKRSPRLVCCAPPPASTQITLACSDQVPKLLLAARPNSPSHEPEPLKTLLAKAGHEDSFKALAETLKARKAAARKAYEAVLSAAG